MSLQKVLSLQLNWTKYLGVSHLKISPLRHTVEVDSNKLRYLIVAIIQLFFVYLNIQFIVISFAFIWESIKRKSKNVDFTSKIFEVVFIFGIVTTETIIVIQSFLKKTRQMDLYNELLLFDTYLQGTLDMTNENKMQYRMNLIFSSGVLVLYLIFLWIISSFSWAFLLTFLIFIHPFVNDMFLYQVTIFVQAIYLRVRALNNKLSKVSATPKQQEVLVESMEKLQLLVNSVNVTFGDDLAVLILKFFLLFLTISFKVYALFFEDGNNYSIIFYFFPQTVVLVQHIYYCTETINEVIYYIKIKKNLNFLYADQKAVQKCYRGNSGKISSKASSPSTNFA